jgi:hypothetical protein
MDLQTQNEINKARARQAVNASAFGKTNNAYPGQNMGLSLQQVKRLVDEANKVQGTSFISAIGTVTPSIQLPATAKFIKGIIFSGTTAASDTFDLLINEERAIATGSVTSFQQQTGKPQLGYYEFLRPVASATAINLNYTSNTAANVVLFSVWYV